MNTPNLSPDALLNALNWRYATKVFDAKKRVSATQWSTLEKALVLTPSSYGLQPWRFINVVDAKLREELKPVSWGQVQVTDASHLVVFAARTRTTEADVTHFVETTAKLRGMPVASMDQYKQMMLANIVKGLTPEQSLNWAARQCYIALGSLMTSAAAMGIDTCPLEGLDPAAYDKILGVPETGYNTVCACAVGFRSSEDKYAKLAKVRYAAEEVIVRK